MQAHDSMAVVVVTGRGGGPVALVAAGSRCTALLLLLLLLLHLEHLKTSLFVGAANEMGNDGGGRWRGQIERRGTLVHATRPKAEGDSNSATYPLPGSGTVDCGVLLDPRDPSPS